MAKGNYYFAIPSYIVLLPYRKQFFDQTHSVRDSFVTHITRGYLIYEFHTAYVVRTYLPIPLLTLVGLPITRLRKC